MEFYYRPGSIKIVFGKEDENVEYLKRWLENMHFSVSISKENEKVVLIVNDVPADSRVAHYLICYIHYILYWLEEWKLLIKGLKNEAHSG